MLRAVPRKPATIERVPKMRAWFESTALPLPAGATATPTDAGGRPALWIRSGDADPARRLLYLHGGAFVMGSPRTHASLAAHLSAAARASVLVLDYRLAPEHPFPAASEDCLAAFRWMRRHGPAGESPASRVFLAGDSAGGNLTLATMLSLRLAGEEPPHAAVTLSAWTDLGGGGESMRTRAAADPFLWPEGMAPCVELHLRGASPANPLASPLLADLHGLAPLLMQVGDAEILLDDTLRFAAKARAAGVDVTAEVWPELFHVFQLWAGAVPEATDAVAKIARFLDRF